MLCCITIIAKLSVSIKYYIILYTKNSSRIIRDTQNRVISSLTSNSISPYTKVFIENKQLYSTLLPIKLISSHWYGPVHSCNTLSTEMTPLHILTNPPTHIHTHIHLFLMTLRCCANVFFVSAFICKRLL